ncbi:MAG: ferrous iron transporter B [Bdellovibrionales bacterium]|nr:ferrous iron transporter B [Bdellovibrionales bacterium]
MYPDSKINLKNFPSVLMIGSPNAGKSTLFNKLTDNNAKTTNYPGTTVDYTTGYSRSDFNIKIKFLDTPGIYSLNPKTAEEEITNKLLFKNKENQTGNLILSVVDSTQFVRQVLITQQLIDQGFSVILVLSMVDILEKNKININIKELSNKLNCPVVPVNINNDDGIKDLIKEIHDLSAKPKPDIQKTKILWQEQDYKTNFLSFQKIEKNLFSASVKNYSSNIDKLLLHPILGLVFFMSIMTLLFASIFWIATPLIDYIDLFFSNLAEVIMQISPGSLWTEFLGDGLISGVGAFMVFVPQIAILFLGLGLLEDSGYLARASSLIDKPLSKLGMNGRSFVPILSSFACAVPAMMAARTIPNKKEKFLTLFILPLMTCSARIPVYALIISFLFFGKSIFLSGFILATLYFAGLLLGGITASIINHFLPQKQNSFFIMELPSYKVPNAKKVFKQMLTRTNSFIKNAGPIIFVLSIIIWASSTFPNYKIDNTNQRFQQSYAAQVGKVIEPVFKPMGADWRVGLGILSSFAAREVFVSTLASVFNITEDNDEDVHKSLLKTMQTARFVNSDGSYGKLIFTLPSILALLVFFMIALQCMATVSVAKNEFGGWKVALIQLFSFNIIAYVLAVITYQGLS